MTTSRSLLLSAAAAGMLLLPAVAQPQTIRINLGTAAPEDSIWHEIALQMRQEWARISGGRVELRIYPGGVQGDEVEMLRKTRLGQLQAVGLSGAGLSRIDASVSCLQIPMLVESYRELDFILERVAPELEARLAKKGFVVLSWSDVGWVHFFTKKPATRLDDIRAMRLFTSAGDPDTESLYKQFGFQPVPLAVTDLLPSLQTGLIDAMDVPPLIALLQQTFGVAGYMTDVKWAPLMGATVIHESAWRRVSPEWRSPMLEVAREISRSRRDEIRRMGDEAIEEMRRRGLRVVEVDAAARVDWSREARDAYPRLRGVLVPADLFDRVLALSDEFARLSANPTTSP